MISLSPEKNGDKVISVINFGDQPVTVLLDSKHHAGTYTDLFTDEKYVLKGSDELALPPWNYLVLVR